MSTEAPKQLKLFYCYTREDKGYCDELDKHLSNLKRLHQIQSWSDREISPGVDREKAIDQELNTAHIILLLISADFMDSNYCYGIEMKRALQRHEAGEARVVPIILRPIDWKDTPFSKLQVLPTGAKPVSDWPNRDAAFLDITQGLRKVVRELQILPKTKEGWLKEGKKLYNLKRYREKLFLCIMIVLIVLGTIGYVAFTLNKSHTTGTLGNTVSTPSPTLTSIPKSCDIIKAPALPVVSSPPNNKEQDNLLKTYKERVTYLVDNCQLHALQPDDQIRVQAENDTATTITKLDGTRNDKLFQFLRNLQLVGKQNVISLAGQNLAGAHLNVCHNGCQGSDGIDLSYLDFTGTNLSRANLNRAKLVGAHLENAKLTNGINIGNVDFTDANLKGATTDNSDVIPQANTTLCRTTMPDGTIASKCST